MDDVDHFDDLENAGGTLQAKRRVLPEPVQLDPDEEAQILADSPELNSSKKSKKGWFGKRSVESPEGGGDGAEKDHLHQHGRSWLPFSKGPLQPYVAQNQDPFQPGST